MRSIFISYRRSDSSGEARHLYDIISNNFENYTIFMDVASITPGENFVEILQQKLQDCDLFIAVIGNTWLNTADDAGVIRLKNDDDYVRMEINAALENKINILPVLVRGAKMPDKKHLPNSLKTFSDFQATNLSHEYFDSDIERIIKQVAELLSKIEVKRALKASPSVFSFVPDPGITIHFDVAAVIAAMEGCIARKGKKLKLSRKYLEVKAREVVKKTWPYGTGYRLQDLISVAENYGAVLYDTWPDYKPSSQKKGTWNKLNAKLFPEKINPDLPPKSWDALDKEASLYKIKSFKVSKFEDIKIQLSLGRPILALIQQKDLYNQPTIQNVRSSILSTKTILIVRYDSDQAYLLAYGGRFLRKDVEYFESHLRYTKIRFDEAKRLFDFDFIWSIDML